MGTGSVIWLHFPHCNACVKSLLYCLGRFMNLFDNVYVRQSLREQIDPLLLPDPNVLTQDPHDRI